MIKQVIVIRKDLNMRKGKLAAQAAHASMKVILDMMSKDVTNARFEDECIWRTLQLYRYTSINDSEVNEWLEGAFTKICVSVNSEEELLCLYQAAKDANIPCSLIVDAGRTEFSGIPTKTCIAIGPASSDRIDLITGHLPLL